MVKHLIEKGYVNNIVKSSIVDGPGNRLVIFMQGCNMDCWYCHNPETLDKSKYNYEFTPLELYQELSKYFPFINGITFSGGEALLQQQFIISFCKLVDSELSIIIDTNASVEIDAELIGLVTGFYVDLKVIDNVEHIKLTKLGNELVLKNIEKLEMLGKLLEIRTVDYPGYSQTSTINYVKNNSKSKHKLLKYNSKGVRELECRKN